MGGEDTERVSRKCASVQSMAIKTGQLRTRECEVSAVIALLKDAATAALVITNRMGILSRSGDQQPAQLSNCSAEMQNCTEGRNLTSIQPVDATTRCGHEEEDPVDHHHLDHHHHQ